MSHAKIPPSSAGIWGKDGGCPGWVLMNPAFPNLTSNEAALDGTLCHEIGERMLKNLLGYQPALRIPEVDEVFNEGTGPICGRTVTQEMIDAAIMYAEECAGWVFHENNPEVGVELRVKAVRVHPESFGTVDFSVADGVRRHIFVSDLKFGFGVVEVFENRQMINYLAGVLDALSIGPDEDIDVTLCVIQPRAFHIDGPVRYWHTTVRDLKPYIEELNRNAAVAMAPNPPTRSGSHCRYCKARFACKAAVEAGIGMYEMVAGCIPQDMNGEELGAVYAIVERAKQQLEFLEKGLKEQVEFRLNKGEHVKNYIIQPVASKPKWKKSTKQLKHLGSLFDVEMVKEEPITPKQAREAGVPSNLVKEYSETSTYMKLKQSNGDRARYIFGRKGNNNGN